MRLVQPSTPIRPSGLLPAASVAGQNTVLVELPAGIVHAVRALPAWVWAVQGSRSQAWLAGELVAAVQADTALANKLVPW